MTPKDKLAFIDKQIEMMKIQQNADAKAVHNHFIFGMISLLNVAQEISQEDYKRIAEYLDKELKHA